MSKTRAEIRRDYAAQIVSTVMINAAGLGDLPPERRKELFKQVASLAFEATDAIFEVEAEQTSESVLSNEVKPTDSSVCPAEK